MDSAIVLLLGIIAQVFYTARAIIQWVQSERHKRIESPTLFWVFSLIGSIFFFAYGWMRNDFSILFGELLSYYIYGTSRPKDLPSASLKGFSMSQAQFHWCSLPSCSAI